MTSGKRLLFVDDERGIRETLSVILQRYGFTVTLAATVSEALDKIQNQNFDILLCDLNIERENDGYDVIRAMQQVQPSCSTVVLTGYPGLKARSRAFVCILMTTLLSPRLSMHWSHCSPRNWRNGSLTA
ncbi:MAG TPA: response regulator [Terriglobales bacterium]|nr:response regulator [Terriglobales bacterium]